MNERRDDLKMPSNRPARRLITCFCGGGPCPTHSPKPATEERRGIASPPPGKPANPNRLGREPGFSFPEAPR